MPLRWSLLLHRVRWWLACGRLLTPTASTCMPASHNATATTALRCSFPGATAGSTCSLCAAAGEDVGTPRSRPAVQKGCRLRAARASVGVVVRGALMMLQVLAQGSERQLPNAHGIAALCVRMRSACAAPKCPACQARGRFLRYLQSNNAGITQRRRQRMQPLRSSALAQQPPNVQRLLSLKPVQQIYTHQLGGPLGRRLMRRPCRRRLHRQLRSQTFLV